MSPKLPLGCLISHQPNRQKHQPLLRIANVSARSILRDILSQLFACLLSVSSMSTCTNANLLVRFMIVCP
jgi:hypothetical protein